MPKAQYLLVGVESRPPLVPYNESSLTRLLKDALAGDARLLVLACLSAATADHDATLDTLAFAQGCRSLTASPKARTLKRCTLPGQPSLRIAAQA